MRSIRLIGRLRRKRRIRKKIFGLSSRPRLTVFKSKKHIYAQIIDDVNSITICSASTLSPEIRQIRSDRKIKGVELAKLVGSLIAKRAREKGIEKVVFDRNGFLYHGRIKSLADAAREGGLNF